MNAVHALFTFTMAVAFAGMLGMAVVVYMALGAWRRSRIVYSERIAPDHGGQVWKERRGDGAEYVRSVARRRPWEPLSPSGRGYLARMLVAMRGRFSRF